MAPPDLTSLNLRRQRRPNALPSQISLLPLCHLDESQHVLQRDVTLNVMGRSKDVASLLAQIDESMSLAPDVLRRPVGQSFLRGEASVEGPSPSVLDYQGFNIHDFGLERVKAVYADRQ